MPQAIRVIDRFQDLGDVNWGAFSDGQYAKYDAGTGKLIGGTPSGSDARLTGTGSLALGAFAGTLPASGTLALRDAANTFTADQTLARAKSLIGTANDGTPNRLLRVDEATNETHLIDAASGGIRFTSASEGTTYLFLNSGAITLPNQAIVNSNAAASTDTSLTVHAPGSGFPRVSVAAELGADPGSSYQVALHAGLGTPAAGRYGVYIDPVTGTAPCYGLYSVNGAGYLGVSDSGTSTVLPSLTLARASSATPAAGFGGGVRAQLQSSTTANRDAAQWVAAWDDATDATRSASVRLFTVQGAGSLTERGRFDGSATANDTGFWLWDANAAALKRVVVGAADSGGTGYRLLRIAN